jgi:signal transduction histidine kinase
MRSRWAAGRIPAGALVLGAVGVATAVLAVLGYFSLRQWETSAELLFREQARDMARMAAEKAGMSLAQAEDELLADVQRLAGRGDVSPAVVEQWRAGRRAVGRVYLLGRDGRLLHPASPSREDADLAAWLMAELPRSVWDREERRRVVVGSTLVLAAVVRGPSGTPLLVALARDPDALGREVVQGMLGALEGKSVVALIDGANRTVHASGPLEGAERVAVAPLGDVLPAWQLAFYQPVGASPRDAVRRQAMLFTGAFALLLALIVVGLVASYRLVRRESEMTRLKADFVANVSHDLKTPLSLIRMFGETLEMNRVADEPTRREYYGVITRESERLTRLIDNVLDFSRIESGRQRYDIAPAALEPLIQEVLEAFRHPLVQGGFKVDVDVEPDLPEVPMDGEAVAQALGNLVDNAIKYSGEKRRLAVTARRGGDEVRIAVEDHGIGIPAAETSRIFEKFYRVGRSETQGRRGSGVGLTLVKHIAEAHGGTITVESRPGQGSRFTLHLPLAAS